MADREPPYDPHIPSDAEQGGPSGPTSGIQGIGDLLGKVQKTTDQMKMNINRVGERGENLDSLQDKTENLAGTSQTFNRGSHRVRKQMWWKDVKMRIWIIVGIIILLIVIIVPSVVASKHA